MKFISDLKKWYLIVFETATILAILLVLFAFKFPTGEKEPLKFPKSDFDTVESIDIPITDPQETPPKPPKPSTFNPVPDHEIVDKPIGDLDINWNSDDPLPLPEKPKDNEEIIFEKVERYPEMKGGIESLYNKINYPQQARLAGIEGIVRIQFVVDKDGSVKNATILRGIGGGCDEEALKAVQELKFVPGHQRGIPVQVRMSLPVIFKLKN